MDDDQKQKLRDDLQFAIMKLEQLTVLDPKAPPNSKNHPLDIKNLVDVFAVFGYAADDFVDKHDQCTIFKRIRGELADLLRDLSTHTKKYDKAVLLRGRLKLIKKEFIDMQCKYEVRRQEQEKQQFQRGVVLARKRTDVSCGARTSEAEGDIQHKREDLKKTHRVERAQLESSLSKLPEPHTKLSKLLLELKDTEKNLSRLHQFEDAKNVYLRADAMEKEERAKNAENFERFKETKRSLLREKQEQKVAELEEKLMEKRYILMRVNENHRKIESQRLTNLSHDMNHCHTMDSHGKKQFSTNVVAAVRKSHHMSGALRGQQLLSTVQGKRLEVTSLCKLHDEEHGALPDGSMEEPSSNSWMSGINSRHDGLRARRAFFDAVALSDLATLQTLLASGLITDVNSLTTMDSNADSLLFRAKDAQIAAFLLRECKADANMRNRIGETPLFDAAREGDGGVSVARVLLENGADVNAHDVDGGTALHHASSAEMVKLLIERGANAQARDKEKRTPLFNAVCFGRADVVEELIRAGADVHAIDLFGRTATVAVNSAVYLAGFEVLIKSYASAGVLPHEGETSMHRAVAHGTLSQVRFLADCGVVIDRPSRTHLTPLYYAACLGHCDKVTFLLDRGTCIHGDPSLQYLPLLIAARHGCLEVVSLLVARGAWFRLKETAPESGIATSGTLMSNLQVLDLLIQECEIVMPAFLEDATITLNAWLSIIRDDLVGILELRCLWYPVSYKLNGFVMYARTGKGEFSHATWVAYGIVALRLWKWVIGYSSRKARASSAGSREDQPQQQWKSQNTTMHHIMSPRDWIDIRILRDEVDEPQVVHRTVFDENRAAEEQQIDRMKQQECALLETAVTHGLDEFKAFIVDEIHRSNEHRHEQNTQSNHRHHHPAWSRLHNAALALMILHDQTIVHGEIASSRASRKHKGITNEPTGENPLCQNAEAAEDGTKELQATKAANEREHRNLEAARWKSPEALRDETRSRASDVYSFGMCILEAVSGQVPWGKVSSGVVRVLASIGRLPKKPENVSDEQWELVAAMCAREPAERPVMSSVVRTLQTIMNGEQQRRKQP